MDNISYYNLKILKYHLLAIHKFVKKDVGIRIML